MKRPILEDLFMISLLVIIVLFMTACGGKSGGSESPAPAPVEPQLTCATLQGTYVEDFSGSVLVIAADCTFTDSYCGYNANYTVPTANPGDSTVTVIGTNGAPGCMSSTPHACQFGWDQNDLGVICDGGSHTYLFHKQ